MKKAIQILLGGVIVPDLTGCFSAADSEEELLDNIREAILLHLEGEDEIPQPSSIVDVAQKGFFAMLVDIELQERTEPVNVTFS